MAGRVFNSASATLAPTATAAPSSSWGERLRQLLQPWWPRQRQMPTVVAAAGRCLFSLKVIFMADLRRKYVCRSAVTLAETAFLFVPFPFSGGIV